ncbi:MAG TPA: LamG-like jellyroll fold domain-containing protein, partial [Chitinivibrionales bacterium]|nr:LamG-like jellyroll fold domain-containing protein [Chitinivibrionales bacterium]
NHSIGNFNLARFTVEVWVCSSVNLINPGSFYNYRSIFDNSFTGLSMSEIRGGYAVENSDLGIPYLGVSTADGTGWIDAMSDSAMLPGRWYFLSATYDGANLRFYVNGAQKSQTPFVGPIKPTKNNARIGCQFQVFDTTGTVGANRNWFVGRIDELKLYGDAFPPDSVRAHYGASFSRCGAHFDMPTLIAGADQEVWLPIYMNNNDTGLVLSNCDITCKFDSSVIAFVDATNQQGIWSNWTINSHSAGSNAVALTLGATGAQSQGNCGEIARCRFKINPGAGVGQSSPVAFSKVLLNESNQQAASTVDGEITVAESAVDHCIKSSSAYGSVFLPAPAGFTFINRTHQSGTIVVHSVQGKRVGARIFSESESQVTIPLKNVASGVYYVTVRTASTSQMKPVVVR